MTRGKGAGGKPPPDDYKIGKGRPPIHSQWKPGESGNRKGRTKGSKNIKTIARKAAKRTITISKNGRKQKLTYLELGIEHLQRDVAQGSRGALREYIAFLERNLDPNESKLSMQELTAQDQLLLDYVFSRARQLSKKGARP